VSKKEGKGALSSLGDFLSSLQLTIGLLIILAVASIFGTVIPQNISPEEYLKIYQVSTYRILKILGFLDMYHSVWFVFLLALLSLNLMVCSLKRLRQTLRFFSSAADRDEKQWETLSPSRKFSLKGSPAQYLAHFKEALSRVLNPPQVRENPSAYYFFAEKGKFARLGVYFIHLSILIILGGALIGSFYGFRGNVNIIEGQGAERVVLRNGQHIKLPGFGVHLEKFHVSYYPTGAPQEFKSILTIVEEDKKVLTEPILVNHPLTYKGITFYQSNYGLAGVERVTLMVKDRESGKEIQVPVSVGQKTAIPESSTSLFLTRFLPDFQGMGPAFQVVLSDSNSPPMNFWLFQNHPEFGERRTGRYRLSIKEIEPIYYSGLQVTKDPGVWLVWLGSSLMIVGFYLTFFVVHRRVWLRLTENRGETLVEMAGSSNRDRLAFEKECTALEQVLQSQRGKESEGQS